MEEQNETPIENCKILFKFRCPKKWVNLKPTSEEGIRFCSNCRKHVYFCTTYAQVATYTSAGDCIAVQLTEQEQMKKRLMDTHDSMESATWTLGRVHQK